MKPQKKKRAGLYTPIHAIFILLILALIFYGDVRYLMLRQSGQEGIWLRLILEIVPALAILLFVWLVVFIFLAKLVQEPLGLLTKEVSNLSDTITAGDKLKPVHARGEISKLSEALENQSEALIELMENVCIQSVKETEESMEQTVAKQIYHTAVPSGFTLEGEGFGIDLCLKSAGVYSDFADAFLLDNHTAFFAIGDVKGSGIPAALAVMKLKSELRSGIYAGKPIGQVVLDVNSVLCAENSERLAVTLFAGIFYAETGQLRFVNMGHIPPVITGMYSDYLQMRAGTPLGLSEKITVGEEVFVCYPGQTLALCTEGVIGAENGNGNVFGRERFLEAVRACTGSPETAAEYILRTATEFRAAEKDDCASLVLRFSGIPTRGLNSPFAAADMRYESEGLYRALVNRAKNGR